LCAYTTDEWSGSIDAVPQSFDSLVFAHVLEHVSSSDADHIISEYLPYLKPSARLVMICPQERGYESDPTHVRFVDLAELEATARRHGFTPTLSTSFPFPRAAGRVFAYNEFVVAAAR
jgi:predicted SAM-dependent methyltransferase